MITPCHFHCPSMASIFRPSATITVQHRASPLVAKPISTKSPSQLYRMFVGGGRCQGLCFKTKAKLPAKATVLENESTDLREEIDYGVVGVHHVGVLCKNLERSVEFYQGILGLQINEARPHDKLPFRGAWLWVGFEMIHLMELPNPDPLTGRPEHGRDRHTCTAIRDLSKLKAILDKAGVPYTHSKSGRPAIFARDPDANALEFIQVNK